MSPDILRMLIKMIFLDQLGMHNKFYLHFLKFLMMCSLSLNMLLPEKRLKQFLLQLFTNLCSSLLLSFQLLQLLKESLLLNPYLLHHNLFSLPQLLSLLPNQHHSLQDPVLSFQQVHNSLLQENGLLLKHQLNKLLLLNNQPLTKTQLLQPLPRMLSRQLLLRMHRLLNLLDQQLKSQLFRTLERNKVLNF